MMMRHRRITVRFTEVQTWLGTMIYHLRTKMKFSYIEDFHRVYDDFHSAVQ